MSSTLTRTESLHFLEYAIRRVAMASGMSEAHGDYIADAIGFAHRQGKLNQGLGVYECIELALQTGALDVKAVPELIKEGPAWAVIDGKRSTGYYCLNIMAQTAIDKARETGIAIVYGGNHNDAGSFARYVYLAYEAGMVGIASNNSVPLAAPYGGMENKLSCPPFDAIVPSGEEAPIWTSIKFAEFYDADISEAVMQDKPMKGKWLIDPESGELTDDARSYGREIPGFGRVWDYSCAGQIESPRTYSLNLWNEAMSAIINPLGVPSTEMPSIEEFENSEDPVPSVGGSYFICINPAAFGPLEAVKARSDAYVRSIKNCRPRPGHTVRMPGEAGYDSIQNGAENVEVLSNHWEPFFSNVAANHGLNEAQLRADFAAGE